MLSAIFCILAFIDSHDFRSYELESITLQSVISFENIVLHSEGSEKLEAYKLPVRSAKFTQTESVQGPRSTKQTAFQTSSAVKSFKTS